MLTISSSIYFNFTTENSLQNLEELPITLHTNAENNALRWNTTWGGASSDSSWGVALDANGSVYCIGETWSFGAGGNDFALVKFAPNGTKLWNVTWGGAIMEIGRDVAVDANDSVYCTGSTSSFGAGGNDLALVKFAPNGTKLWNTTWGGANQDGGYGVAVDASGAVYNVGNMPSFGAGSDEFGLAKFAPNGTKLWNVTWGSAYEDPGHDVAVDIDGSVYCSGSTETFGAGGNDFALVKFGLKPPEPPVLDPISPDPDEDGIIELNWSAVTEVDKYYIYRELSNITSVVGLTPKYAVTESNYTDTLATNGTYYYVIVAGTAFENSSISNCESVTVAIPPEPEEPGGIPGFELVYILIGLLALIYIGQRRSLYRTIS